MAPDRLRPDLAPVLGHRTRPGPTDSVVDVPGVRVGHTTLVAGERIRTGVTAIVPAALGPDRLHLPAAVFTGNGHGKLVGSTEIDELGRLQTPVVLTSTLSAFVAADALLGWVLERPEHRTTVTLNPVVAECNDGWLSDIRARPVREHHVRAALDGATSAVPAEGCVGAGTGMRALGFKGGIGTASRRCAAGGRAGVVGALSLTNFSGRLRVAGRVVDPPAEAAGSITDPLAPEGNSCVNVVLTDLPLDARQLGRLARRAVFAMSRLGADFAHGSGDYGLAIGVEVPDPPPDEDLDPVLLATLEAVEAAILRSLLAARTTTGVRGRTAVGLDPRQVLG